MATYTAQLNEWVRITTNSENNTITAPPSPSNGHWFGVKMLTVTGTDPTPTRFQNTIAANSGQQIEDIDGKGPVASTLLGFNYESSRWIFIDGVWWRLDSKPLGIPELFDKEAGSLLITTDTPIPLVYDPTFDIVPTYFQTNAGALECIRPFAGSVDLRVYFEYVLPANNDDAGGVVDFYTVAQNPLISQGKGAAASFAHSRSGTYYLTITNKAVIVARPGDIIGLRGSNDPGQPGDTYVIEDTGVLLWPI